MSELFDPEAWFWTAIAGIFVAIGFGFGSCSGYSVGYVDASSKSVLVEVEPESEPDRCEPGTDAASKPTKTEIARSAAKALLIRAIVGDGE